VTFQFPGGQAILPTPSKRRVLQIEKGGCGCKREIPEKQVFLLSTKKVCDFRPKIEKNIGFLGIFPATKSGDLPTRSRRSQHSLRKFFYFFPFESTPPTQLN
jgi:hypothetical protein